MAKLHTLPKSQRFAAYGDDWLGFLALFCTPCVNIPLCVVGFGMAAIDLIANPTRRHTLTWLALFGNCLVVLGFGAVLILAVVLRP
jgi:hypothetical protein